MQYGHFDDRNKEYVIDRPDTPKSWSNYLGTTEYGAIITNNAGGYSFYKSSAQGRYTRTRTNAIPLDQPGRYFYIRDNESKDYWSTSWQPVGKPLNKYKTICRHGTAYTVIESEYSEIKTEATYFVPLESNFEVWMLKITNNSSAPRKLSVFSYLEFASEWNLFQDLINLQFTQYTIKMDYVDGIIRYAMLDNVPEDPQNFQNRDQCRNAFFAVTGAEVKDYETDRDTFIGGYRTYANPVAVENNKCTNSLAHGDNGCAGMRFEIDLAPGESREMAVLVGIGKAEREGKEILKKFGDIAVLKKELQKVKDHWHSLLGVLTVQTPDKEFNSMINVWNAYNSLITFAWSRAASLVYSGERDGLGYRDTVQDMLGALSMIPADAGKRLELMITGQVSTGGAMSVVKQFAHNPGHEQTPEPHHYRSDDCLWLFNTIPAYVKETGDMTFYTKILPYADKGKDTVLGHLRRAIEFNLERSGAHGLPCGLEADWNDCLKLGYRGESIFVTFQLRYGLKIYIDICTRLKFHKEIEWAEKKLAELDVNIQKHCWDGEWFIRAFREDGSIIGTKNDPEGSIFLNAQSWAVLSGAATVEQAETAMQSVKDRLSTEYGIMLCAPPFRKTDYHVVRAVVLNEGHKENGGIFSHTQGWAVMAETLLGHGDRAYEYYRNYMPAAYNTKAEIRQIEPYVHCQSTHSKYSRRFGASRLPWLSGTASWSYFSATQNILGIQPDYDGLKIDPCLPSDWKEIKVSRKFRGKDFNITIRNGKKGKGVKSLNLNGETMAGNLIPQEMFKANNDVVVLLE
ncbi:MAG TPA: N,N'-diacetylchitobiose phosphorylase [Lentisphaeria bacterium]|nr:MAG: N,N'-diacetylchitobiose phosphorylase [Lentisphaerae bacterium GWF2_50_93]HCE45826.1 N,N'-diacetylchitobiose phosphorylase [Lentisphaeria bacterium]